MTVTIEQIRAFFSTYRPKEQRAPHLKRAAILIPFFEKKSALHVLLTKRTESVEHHKGQISFPGGAMDDHDADSVTTALRETEEEIGLKKSVVEVLGVFDDYTTPSGYRITPVVGFVASVPALQPSTDEVAEIFEVPLSFFLDKKNERVVPIMRNGKWRDVYFYNYGPYKVWGVTAAILRSFLNALKLSSSSSFPPEGGAKDPTR